MLSSVLKGFSGIARRESDTPSVEAILSEVDVPPVPMLFPPRFCDLILLFMFHLGVAGFHIPCYTIPEACALLRGCCSNATKAELRACLAFFATVQDEWRLYRICKYKANV